MIAHAPVGHAGSVTRLGGCCGLAGNWGFEPGHYEAGMFTTVVVDPA